MSNFVARPYTDSSSFFLIAFISTGVLNPCIVDKLVLHTIVYCCMKCNVIYSIVSDLIGWCVEGRMDSYVDKFMEHGGSMISLAKGNRSKAVTNAVWLLHTLARTHANTIHILNTYTTCIHTHAHTHTPPLHTLLTITLTRMFTHIRTFLRARDTESNNGIWDCCYAFTRTWTCCFVATMITPQI